MLIIVSTGPRDGKRKQTVSVMPALSHDAPSATCFFYVKLQRRLDADLPAISNMPPTSVVVATWT
jgi:hypothetical protein